MQCRARAPGEYLPRPRDPYLSKLSLSTLGKKQIQQKMQVRVPTKGTLAFIHTEKNICGTTPHTARLPQMLGARIRCGICGENFNLTKRSIFHHVVGRELSFRELDSSSPAIPRNLGVHYHFGSILPMLGEEIMQNSWGRHPNRSWALEIFHLDPD
jgi:hypothetical protein